MPVSEDLLKLKLKEPVGDTGTMPGAGTKEKLPVPECVLPVPVSFLPRRRRFDPSLSHV